MKYIIDTFLILYLVTPFFAYSAAKRKGRSYNLWALLTILFSPLILILECLPNINYNQTYLVHCETCDREIAFAARSCPQCGQPRKTMAYVPTYFDHLSKIGERIICFLQFFIVASGLFLIVLFYLFYSTFVTLIALWH